ncbi:MAG: biotin transporter BioY [Acidimicrobiia bacterium]|nr:MAG: biotin transporter BioY [Acidimicrobiia bacterium]
MQTTYPARTIVNVVVPRNAVTTATLMVGFALLTALAAQIVIPIPGSPVPITGQTFAVLLAGAALGSRAGAGSQLIYWAMGAVGLPFYADGRGGWEVATGATAGYLVGFVAAAWVIGLLAERGHDRSVPFAIPAFLAGNAIIYLFGVPWLIVAVPAIDSVSAALIAGFVPFVVGDILKIVAAGLLLPAAWKMVDVLRR